MNKTIKQIITITLCIPMLILMNNTGASALISSELEIRNIIESFFWEYEKTVDTEDTINASYEQYFVKNKSLETEINLALIDVMIYQNIVNWQNHYSGNHIKELNKELSFNYSKIQVQEKTANADIVVYKTFNYNICPDIESAMLDSYTIELKLEDNNWKIVEINNFIPDDMLIPLNNEGIRLNSMKSIESYKNSILERVEDYNIDIASKSNQIINPNIQTMAAVSYNASGAVSYANTYVLNPNINYFNNEGGGGDCTNFASQVLNEGGGIPEHFGTHGYNDCWFYTSSGNRSSSWAGAQNLYNYMFGSYSKINATATNFSSISTGDLIQLGTTTSITHSMIVTGIVMGSSGRTDLLVTYRSTTNNHKKNVLASSRTGTKQYIHIAGSK